MSVEVEDVAKRAEAVQNFSVSVCNFAIEAAKGLGLDGVMVCDSLAAIAVRILKSGGASEAQAFSLMRGAINRSLVAYYRLEVGPEDRTILFSEDGRVVDLGAAPAGKAS